MPSAGFHTLVPRQWIASPVRRFDLLLDFIDPLDAINDSSTTPEFKQSVLANRPRVLGLSVVDCLAMIAPCHSLMKVALEWQSVAAELLSNA
eukprot:5164772-Prymnesium_polylepis.1